MFASVAIDLALDRLFTYEVPVELSTAVRVGQLVRVPFGASQERRGFVMSLAASVGEAKFAVKPILGVADPAPFFSPALLALVKWIARYTASPIERCLRAAVPAAVLKPAAHAKELLFVAPALAASPVTLTARQRALYDDVVRVGGGWLQSLCRELKTTPATIKSLGEKGLVTILPRAQRRDPLAGRRVLPQTALPLNPLQRAALDVILGEPQSTSHEPRATSREPVLLHGVTGSGKTEIYLQAIAKMLAEGKGAIVLVPEIALTPQTVRRFVARFGERVAVLHSALSDGERYDEWHRIRKGEARVVVGPRSAVFAPVANLGLIVVDEEHDPSYKQGETPRYHARDVAVVRAKLEGARVVLGSATPSLESWRNAQLGKYVLASVPERVAGRSLPEVHLVNMAEEAEGGMPPPVYSRFLLDAVAERLRRGEQTILFLNRRGYSRVLECKTCGYVAACPSCSTPEGALPFTYHQSDDCLRCHVCGAWQRVPAVCPGCGARDFKYVGVGTQRAEAILKKCFPRARILRMDADSTSRKNSHDDILTAFRNREADVLLGTQMIAKGLDFPNVTLVGVLNADSSLNRPDFRAGERTYQLLAQVSGRAGRADKPGEVWIQTRQPDAPSVKAAADGAYETFAADELAERRLGYFPPFCRLSTLLFRARSEPLAAAWARLWSKSLAGWAAAFNKTAKPPEGVGADDEGRGAFRVSEATPAALAEAEGWFRWQVVLRTPTAADAVTAVKWIRAERPAPDSVRIAFDVDAVELL